MHPVDYLIFGGWVVFWVGWLAASIRTKASTRRGAGRFVGVRILLIVLVLSLARSRAFSGSGALISDPWLQAVGTALFFAGLGLAVWARACLGRNWGMPMSEKADPELVTNGPYRRVRHPIYSGIILAWVGTMIAVQWYWAVVVVVAGGYFVYSAVVEERNMSRLFPGTYPEYRSRTKMLVPFVF
jgi:protein-S-isoprenylcysteine O-methyltransferase Ste14